jgi:hypothetical protein
MNSLNEFVLPEVLQASWMHCLWGIAAIGDDGNVLAVNPAFEHCIDIEISAALGMSEADLSHAIQNSQVHECHRVKVIVDGLRAIYYMRCECCSTKHSGPDPKISQVAEMLREPLASIYGFTELLLTQSYDEDTRTSLTAALLEQVEVMSNLINEQLDVRNHK